MDATSSSCRNYGRYCFYLSAIKKTLNVKSKYDMYILISEIFGGRFQIKIMTHTWNDPVKSKYQRFPGGV